MERTQITRCEVLQAALTLWIEHRFYNHDMGLGTNPNASPLWYAAYAKDLHLVNFNMAYAV